jgi:PAS domain S-box-containing protein
MFHFLKNVSIGRKLTLANMVTSSAALLLASAGFVAYERYNYQRELIGDLDSMGALTSYNCAAALAFADVGSATQTLGGLAIQPHIVAAWVYDKDGRLFASYQREAGAKLTPPPVTTPLGEHFADEHIDLLQAIMLDNERVGTIALRADLTQFRARLVRYALIVSAVMFMAILAAYLIALPAQRVIATPIVDLAKTTEKVATEKNYSLRAIKHGSDEIGQLIDGFNAMLEQIQSRDAALQRANDELEHRVEERTAQLKEEVVERGRVAEALRNSEMFLNSLLQSLPLGIFRKDTDGRYIYGNDFFTSRFGRSEKEMIGRTDYDLAPAEMAKQYLADDDKVMSTRQALERDEIEVLPSGEKRWIHIIKVPITGQNGHVTGTQGMYWDVTERKLAEEQLEQMHRQLLDTSRQAGMAEIATGVLHNVGNVLNSVNVSATLVAEQVRHSKAANLARVVELFKQHEADLGAFLTADPKGRIVPAYLGTLADNLAEERKNVIGELEQLRKNVEHIKDIVAMQQSYAKTSGVNDTISVPDLVEDALRMNAGSLARHDIDIARDYQVRPVVTVDKHRVMQILINLIRNAKYACDESGRVDKLLTLRITADERFVRIAVIDNGVGIPAENLTRIFAHGFTTRSEGHGFGLHSGALAAKELGGSLTAHSEGPGQGATFTLEIPFKPETRHP